MSQAEIGRDELAASFVARQQRPRVVIKADLLPAISVLSTIGLIGIPLGWLWSEIAPAQQLQVVEGGTVPLPAETYHRFDGLVIFVLLGLVAGLLTGIGVWLLRERRGPVIMLAAVLGSTLSGWLALQIGGSFAQSAYEITGTPEIGDVLAKAPEIESALVLIAQPLTTVLAYGLLAAWNGMDDLGRRLG
ncbi:DUF2567 domain-containing protein [Tamaricihabitans halophyticus]|uniref:DUF2567 domain-containing protein n=1 Tax=Tamaricihabitans halophyticus TaxID=1262583 RepID=UPI001FB4EB43|nr:DUF2567 domain-containing protein [Tamaricihabitans halophyticus]